MKLRDVERHLSTHGARKVEEGANHTTRRGPGGGPSVAPGLAPGPAGEVSRVRTTLLLAATAAVLAATPGLASADQVGPDYITSDNVEYLGSFKPATGLTAGARIIGDRMYVTSSKDLEIFDISSPETPRLMGAITVNVQFENEEVPTNGRLLGISSDLVNSGVECAAAGPAGLNTVVGGGCLRLYDVRDPAAVKELPSVPGAGDHTSTCILDCTYLYGSDGSIVDARTALEPGGRAVKLAENWKSAVEAQGVRFEESCHNVREVRPGILITACQPSEVLSVLPEDGGSPTSPKVLFTGRSKAELDQFIHSARWPRAGQDAFILIGGERNFQPRCDGTVSAFQTFDASHVGQDGTYTPIDEIRPINGAYLDSNPPAQVLGCSVHWFEEHPTFRDGGLVALAEYENGVRFLQIQADGKIREQGFFIPLGGSASAPHWASTDSDILYSIDYERGIDVLRYRGSHYVPVKDAPPGDNSVEPEPGTIPGTEGAQPKPIGGSAAGPAAAACARSAGFDRALALPAGRRRGSGKASGPALRFAVSRRERRRFGVDVFQVSRERRILRERLVARFRNRAGSFTWSARRARSGARLADGTYFARFTMRRPGREADVRRVTLTRRDGRFRPAPPFYARDTCGILRSFKLERPVFGGTGAAPLRVAYRLNTGADSIRVEVLQGSRVVRTFSNRPRLAGRTYRLRVPASVARRGSDVRVRITLRRSNSVVRSTLTARRL